MSIYLIAAFVRKIPNIIKIKLYIYRCNDGLAVVEECTFREITAVFVDGCLLPEVADVAESYVAVAAYCVDEPYVPVEIVFCHCPFDYMLQR